jgi:hypothetical protein
MIQVYILFEIKVKPSGRWYALHDNSYTPLSITAEILPSEVNQQPINVQPINNLFKYSTDIITKMHFFRAV